MCNSYSAELLIFNSMGRESFDVIVQRLFNPVNWTLLMEGI
jgi:hypothetical protein